MTRRPKLFRTPHTFDTPEEAINYFNENRDKGVEELSPEVCAFLLTVAAYDAEARFNVQPGFSTHYIAAAQEADRNAWFYAKPGGVTFCTGDARNADAILDMWEEAMEPEGNKMLITDVWFPAAHLTSSAAQFCLRLAAAWATR